MKVVFCWAVRSYLFYALIQWSHCPGRHVYLTRSFAFLPRFSINFLFLFREITSLVLVTSWWRNEGNGECVLVGPYHTLSTLISLTIPQLSRFVQPSSDANIKPIPCFLPSADQCKGSVHVLTRALTDVYTLGILAVTACPMHAPITNSLIFLLGIVVFLSQVVAVWNLCRIKELLFVEREIQS